MTSHSHPLVDRIKAKKVTVGVIGLGYVGLPLAVTAADRGFKVIGFDVDAEKIDLIGRKVAYIDAVKADTLAKTVDNGTLSATTDFAELSKCGVIIICVPTPLTRHREPDMSYIVKTTEVIAKYLARDTLVVLESTTYPGTTDEVLAPILETSGMKVGKDFYVGFSPEREDPGNSKFKTATIPKVVAGDGQPASDMVQAFYSGVVDTVVPVSSTRTAEAVKITENIFRAVNIALVNELKTVYDAMGIDVWEVVDAAATKPFGFMPFYPGPGLGGHCIPIDPFYLTWKAREFEVPTRFIELAGEVNTNMPRYVISRLRSVLDKKLQKGLSGSRILLVGIAYKKNVNDMRESPSIKLIELLEKDGAHVDFIDPYVPVIPKTREHMELAGRKSIEGSALKSYKCDAVLISTDHDNIDYKAVLDLGVPVVDSRNAIARRKLPMDLVVKA
jgi:UDP-N-acetyl-D-glucosamine dehydrogenase